MITTGGSASLLPLEMLRADDDRLRRRKLEILITLIGLGPGDADLLARGAEAALRAASAAMAAGSGRLTLRTGRHPCVQTLRDWGLEFDTCDDLYDTAPDFAATYSGIAERILKLAEANPPEFVIGYATPGHPLVGEESVRLILDRCASLKLPVAIAPSPSFVDAVVAAAGIAVADGFDVRDALTLSFSDRVDEHGDPLSSRIDTSRGLLLFQVFDSVAASNTKLALMRDYPDEWEITVIRSAGVRADQQVRRIPLYGLDREPVDHLTSVFVPPLPPSLRPGSFTSLAGIMSRLRAPNGCPWDREQSYETLKRYLVEETYEVLEAIDQHEPRALCEELGDLLLQIVFHSQLAAEEGVFTLDDVTAGIVTKLIRRHPHVFGTVAVSDSDEVLRNWELIKRQEKADQPDWRRSILDGIPAALPALMRAQEISKRVHRVGFDWESLEDVFAKLDEELQELRSELYAPTPAPDRIKAELGDLLFTIVQIARWQKIDAEEALRTMLMRFSARFRYIERRVEEQSRNLAELTLQEMETLWQEAKQPDAS